MPSQDTQFKKGEGGRPLGVPNKFTSTVKETVLEVFKTAHDDPELCLMAFLRQNPKYFYLIAAKLIPTEVRADIHTPEGIQVIIEPSAGCKPIGTNPDDPAQV